MKIAAIKKHKFSALLGLLALAFLLSILYGQQKQKQFQHSIQAKGLNRAFVKIAPKGSQVALTPSGGWFSVLVPAENSSEKIEQHWVKETRTFSIGDIFIMQDHHFGVSYTIQRIDTDGVVIGYESSGNEPSQVRSANGSVKLLWK